MGVHFSGWNLAKKGAKKRVFGREEVGDVGVVDVKDIVLKQEASLW